MKSVTALKSLFRRVARRYRPSSENATRSYIDQLIDMGLVVGSDFHLGPDVIIDSSHCWHISIGDSVTLAPKVHILAHDASTKMFLGLTRIGRVSIGNQVFVGAGSIILPGVEIGSRVIIGAGSVVLHDIPNNSVAVGSPAKVICGIDDFLARRQQEIRTLPVFDASYTVTGGVTELMKAQMNERMKHSFAYIE